MDEDAAIIDSILNSQPDLTAELLDDDHTTNNNGWTTVSYSRRHTKLHSTPENTPPINDVFHSVDTAASDRRRRVVEAQRAALAAVTGVKDDDRFSGDNSDDDVAAVEENDAEVVTEVTKAVKVKKPKKARVSVTEAAAKIDPDDLVAFFVDISESYESQEDIQLMRFADYMGRAFGSVGSAQFPWMKMLKESPVSKLLDIPLCHVPEAVYKTSVDWLAKHSVDALASFVLWLWDGILADLATHQGTVKGSIKVSQQAPSKSQVALFVVMGMTLRRRPEVLFSLLPILKESEKYVGHDKLHLTVWVITQASQGDLAVGLYMWVQVLLPMLIGKSVNPQSRDLILQLVERIVGMPKARLILLNGAVRKGERLVPPAAFDTLMRLTFPPASSRVKATERFEAIYPTLKEVALAGASGSKLMKQVTQQILSVSIEAAGEGEPELAKEASDVFIWCLTENPDCYKQWDNLYLHNIKASALLLKRLYSEKKLRSAKSASLEPVKAALNSFKMKNRNAIGSKEHGDDQTGLKEAGKYCKLLLAQLSKGHECAKSLFMVAASVGVVVVLFNLVQFDELEGHLSRLGLKL